MEEAILNEIQQYQKQLSQIAGPRFEVVHKYYGNELPYRWEVRTVVARIEHVVTIKFNKDDFLHTNGKSEAERLEYLRSRFQSLFMQVSTAQV